ncbi:MAG: Kdo hydroxylase family protein [Caulobacteraceae bacterium]
MEVLELDSDAADASNRAAHTLEVGGLVLFPHLPFALEAEEQAFLDPAILGKSKNVSLNPADGVLSGTSLEGQAKARLASMVARFSARADALLANVTPHYVSGLQKRRTSFRPGAVTERVLSPRKDDRRLHVDAFPANPVQGRRILRVFANVNPHGEPRLWDVGEDSFETFAQQFSPQLRKAQGGGWLMEKLGLTKGRRTGYDQVMLQLHDTAKLDEAYQASAAKRRLSFAPGAMWIVYTDSVLHAALGGQHAFEQTYLMPPQAMCDERLAPVRVLERLLERPLC